VKAFGFRLAQALRWREQCGLLEEARVAVAGARVAAVRAAYRVWVENAAAAARGLTTGGAGAAFYSYDGFLKASSRRALALIQEEKAALAEYAAGMMRLVEATRRVRLLENLREADRQVWQNESDRELAEFADEAFLLRQSALRRAESRRSCDASNTPVADGTIRK
jgi:hypothetical protein